MIESVSRRDSREGTCTQSEDFIGSWQVGHQPTWSAGQTWTVKHEH